MERVGNAGLVGADTSHLDGIMRIRWASFGKSWSDESDDVMSPGKNQEADETLIAIDYEIPAKLLWFFVMTNQVAGRHGTDITPDGLMQSVPLWR